MTEFVTGTPVFEPEKNGKPSFPNYLQCFRQVAEVVVWVVPV